MVRLNDLVCDLVNEIAVVQVAGQSLDIAEKRLLDALALNGTPLLVRGEIVVGGLILRRPYESLPVEISEIVNVPLDTVVVAKNA